MMLTGHIVADAKKEVSPTGNERVTFRIGNNEYNNQKDEEGKPITYWFSIVSFSPRALALSKYLTKGKLVSIIGDYNDNIYQNKTTGNCEIGRNIVADSIEFVNAGTSESTSKTTSSATNTTTQKTEMPKVTSSGAAPKEPMKAKKVVLSDDNVEEDDDLPF